MHSVQLHQRIFVKVFMWLLLLLHKSIKRLKQRLAFQQGRREKTSCGDTSLLPHACSAYSVRVGIVCIPAFSSVNHTPSD